MGKDACPVLTYMENTTMMFLDSYNYTACNALEVVNYLQALAWCLGYDGVPGTEAIDDEVRQGFLNDDVLDDNKPRIAIHNAFTDSRKLDQAYYGLHIYDMVEFDRVMLCRYGTPISILQHCQNVDTNHDEYFAFDKHSHEVCSYMYAYEALEDIDLAYEMNYLANEIRDSVCLGAKDLTEYRDCIKAIAKALPVKAEATVHKVQRLMWDARIAEQEATDCYF